MIIVVPESLYKTKDQGVKRIPDQHDFPADKTGLQGNAADPIHEHPAYAFGSIEYPAFHDHGCNKGVRPLDNGSLLDSIQRFWVAPFLRYAIRYTFP